MPSRKRPSNNPIIASATVFYVAGYKITNSDIKRLCSKLVEDPSGCLIWLGPTRAGYGRISVAGRMVGTHCLAYFAANGGFLPADNQLSSFDVAHSCHVRACCNPQHLRLATTAVNLGERDARHDSSITHGNALYVSRTDGVPSKTPTSDVKAPSVLSSFLSICKEIEDLNEDIRLIGAIVGQIPQPSHA